MEQADYAVVAGVRDEDVAAGVGSDAARVGRDAQRIPELATAVSAFPIRLHVDEGRVEDDLARPRVEAVHRQLVVVRSGRWVVEGVQLDGRQPGGLVEAGPGAQIEEEVERRGPVHPQTVAERRVDQCRLNVVARGAQAHGDGQ